MTSRRNTLRSILAVTAAAGLCASGAAPAGAEGATVTHSDLSAGTSVPCALNGAGEDVLVEGRITMVTRFGTDSSGGTHARVHSNYHNFSGTGLTSGTRYRAVATENSTSHNFEPFVGAPYSFTFVQQIRFIGQGPGNDFIVVDKAHVTVNANDEVTAEHDLFSVECR